MKLLLRCLLFASTVAILAACGGGGGGGGGGGVGGGGDSTPKAFGTAVLIETSDAGNTFAPQIAIDANGNALAVWEELDGERFRIWENRYTAGTGWGTAALMKTVLLGSAGNPRIAMRANGDALAVWQQLDGAGGSYIVSNRYTSATGWGTAVIVDTAGNAVGPRIAMDTNGNALALWHQSNGTRISIWANRYTADADWGTPTLVETDDVGDASEPQIAFDANGDALAVWQQSDGTRLNVWANRYTAGAGWGTPILIETEDAGSALKPQIAIDANGHALAVWYQDDGTRYNIVANRYTAGIGWGTAALIETDNAGSAMVPQIAIDASGNAMAVWQQSDGARSNIWANRYTVGQGWGTAVLIESDNAGHAEFPQIAVDAVGNALAVWQQHDGTRNNTVANRYTAGTGWGTAQLIETDNAGDAYEPQIAIDAHGNALAVWSQSNGTRISIWANRFQ